MRIQNKDHIKYVRINASDKNRLHKICRNKNMRISEFIRLAIKEKLEREEQNG